jgi:hypothetical protein
MRRNNAAEAEPNAIEEISEDVDPELHRPAWFVCHAHVRSWPEGVFQVLLI